MLLGVPTVIIGFRQDNGVLAGFQSFETLDIPRLFVSLFAHQTLLVMILLISPSNGIRVAEKPHVWHASSCLNSGHHIFTYLLSTLAQSPLVKAFDEQLSQGVVPASEFVPVFRVSYTPASKEGKFIRLRSLSSSEVEDVVKGKSNVRQRSGFLPLEWMQGVQMRKAK